jgi:hypothetical protein
MCSAGNFGNQLNPMAGCAVWWPPRIARPPTSESMPLPPAAHDIAERHALTPGSGFRLVMLGLGISVVPLDTAVNIVCTLKTLSTSELCHSGTIGSLKPMTGWVLQWLSALRMRFRQRRDLLLEFIVLRHQLVVLQRTGTQRPCFRPSERLFWVFLSRWWANWQHFLAN